MSCQNPFWTIILRNENSRKDSSTTNANYVVKTKEIDEMGCKMKSVRVLFH